MSSLLPELNRISRKSQICDVASLPFDSCFFPGISFQIFTFTGVRNMSKCTVVADDAERCLTFHYEMTSDMRKLSLANTEEIWKYGNNIKDVLLNLKRLKFVNKM